MPTHETTISRLLDERRRQDEAFRALCATLAVLDADQHFRLSETRALELETAWEFAATSVSRPSAWYSLRA